MPGIDDLREQLGSSIRRLGKESISIAWLLAPIRTENSFKQWGYKSYNQFLKGELCNPADPARCFLSKAYAYALTNIGMHFFGIADVIELRIANNEMGIAYLRDLSDRVKNGMSLSIAVDHILDPIANPLPEEERVLKKDSEAPTKVEAFVRSGDEENFNKVLMIQAAVYGHPTLNAALNDIVLSQLLELESILESPSMKHLERFKSLISNGKYYCKLCGNIPSRPTLHHILPVSIGQGYGPQVLLCWAPCHEEIVQPKWEFYADKFLGEKDAHRRLTQEADEYIKEHGAILVPEDVMGVVIQ